MKVIIELAGHDEIVMLVATLQGELEALEALKGVYIPENPLTPYAPYLAAKVALLKNIIRAVLNGVEAGSQP